MIETALDDIAQFIRGGLDVERTSSGVIPLRLPLRFAHQIPNPITLEVFRMASGIRLSLLTTASVLECDLVGYRVLVDGFVSPVRPVTFDLVIDGNLCASATTDMSEKTFSRSGELISETSQHATTLCFDDLPRTNKVVEVWFPPNAVVEIRGLRTNAPIAQLSQERPRWIHYGSSISHCVEAHSPTQTWPAVAAHLADVDLVNLGVGGACHLDQFVARAIRATRAAYISLKVGINIANGDTLKYRTFGPAVHGFLDTVREGHPETPILLISPILCPIHEDAPGPSVLTEDGHLVAAARVADPANEAQALSIRRMREILEEIVRIRRNQDPNLHYLNGLTLFDEKDLADLPDRLHPSGDGYVRVGERFAEAAFGPEGRFARPIRQV